MKANQCHGISIGIERIETEFFLYFKAVGRLSHEDYEMISPLIDQALQGVAHPQVKAFFDATDFEGWDLRAAWDDFTLALRHGSSFSRVAILGNSPWQKFASDIAAWFLTGDVHYFEDREDALEWLAEEGHEESKEKDRGSAPESDMGLGKIPTGYM